MFFLPSPSLLLRQEIMLSSLFSGGTEGRGNETGEKMNDPKEKIQVPYHSAEVYDPNDPIFDADTDPGFAPTEEDLEFVDPPESDGKPSVPAVFPREGDDGLD